jgi:peptide-methionine (S)-S-oxide reductase
MMKISLLIMMMAFINGLSTCSESRSQQLVPYTPKPLDQNLSKAYFAAGCFWCVEAIFESVIGVQEVISGYSGGSTDGANYDEVSSGDTGHAETVEIHYNPAVVRYETLLELFFGSHDATTLNRQGPDAGTQYRSAIFYQNDEEKNAALSYINKLYKSKEYAEGSITTEVAKFNGFFPAEEYHQDYEKRNPNQPYVRGVSIPRLNKFQAKFPEVIKKEKKH